MPHIATTSLSTVHSLAILQEYTHTLDALPVDLSRNFADLRELDAVLSSSMAVLISKINQLTYMIENSMGTKDERLWLLAEVAEEAGRLKPGADDKIRVACVAADGLRAHKSHMSNLLDRMPDQAFGRTASALARKTVYPHISSRSFMPAGTSGEGGRSRRRGAYGSLMTASNIDATPNKRKRVSNKDEDGETIHRSPRKERTAGEPQPRPRGNARTKKNERATSPAESILSVTSHLPQSISHQPNHNTSQQSKHSNGGRSGNTAVPKRGGRAQGHVHSNSIMSEVNIHETTNGRHDTSVSVVSSAIPNTSSVPTGLQASENRNSKPGSAVGEWAHGHLEGPGVPPPRAFVDAATVAQAEGEEAGTSANAGGGENEDDGGVYCYCGRGSFGDMVACDDENCEREWFHLPCTGLAVVPAGEWFCDNCQQRRATKRPGRGGKRRAGGARSAARNTSA